MNFDSLLGNALFFGLDIILTIILIPIVLSVRKRVKNKHLVTQTLKSIDELMEVGGSLMIKFNQVAYRLNNTSKNYLALTEEERIKHNLTQENISKYRTENVNWFTQFSNSYEKEINGFSSVIELFSPHYQDASLLILVSKLNKNAQYALSSMEAILMSFRQGTAIPEDLFGSINASYTEMEKEISLARKKKAYKTLKQPKTLEEMYNHLKDGEKQFENIEN
ncbi:hypothetical protein [Flavivirga jejuensis]|uniref:Uncharacterized protein n=1 Tax=Flavivirga jejuensis TaxID=870487 RepID=A0ABT8WQP5_9FLAO|nr:hypothetical protein [Flavivirga jejuensis]MDO5975484.1 hypothetical protein [Flavivirga jejuensis]